MHMYLFSFYIKVSVVWNDVRAVHYFIVQQCYILHIKCFRWAKSRHLCLWVDHKRQNSDTASQSKWFVIYDAVRDEWIDIYGGFQLRSTDGRKCFGKSGEKLHQNFKINILGAWSRRGPVGETNQFFGNGNPPPLSGTLTNTYTGKPWAV